MAVSKFNYKIRNKATGKYWSSGVKATWLQATAAATQAESAMRRWGADNTEVLVIPIDMAVPAYPAKEWILSLEDAKFTAAAVNKKVRNIITVSYKRYQQQDIPLDQALRNMYNLISSVFSVCHLPLGDSPNKFGTADILINVVTGTTMQDGNVTILVRMVIHTNRGNAEYTITVPISDPKYFERITQRDRDRATREALKAAAEATTQKEKEDTEYQLFMKLHDKFKDKLSEGLAIRKPDTETPLIKYKNNGIGSSSGLPPELNPNIEIKSAESTRRGEPSNTKLKERTSNQLWTDYSGKKRPLNELTTQHLSNIIWFNEFFNGQLFVQHVKEELASRGTAISMWRPLPIPHELQRIYNSGLLDKYGNIFMNTLKINAFRGSKDPNDYVLTRVGIITHLPDWRTILTNLQANSTLGKS